MGIYDEFFSEYNFDVRVSKDARWIDQKCTYDVINMIADCILEYVNDDESKEFTVSDIWHSEYARDNVIDIFSKPDPEKKGRNEYDKYFGQPIKLLSYSKVLNVRKKGNVHYYSVKHNNILTKIAGRNQETLSFLYEYIRKVLVDSDLFSSFEKFFEEQNPEEFKKLKDKFITFTIKYTNINGKIECGRIFTKVINPLAFKNKKLGTSRGYLSKTTITLQDITYNRSNWRDVLSGKEKSKTRNEHEIIKKEAQIKYYVNKAKKDMHNFNNNLFQGVSEIYKHNENIEAKHAHHIFPKSQYVSISDYVENLIMLTPNQHLYMAHPNNNTRYIDKDFQYVCLISKLIKIYQNLTDSKNNNFYDFDRYKKVLNVGLNTEIFTDIENMDFVSIINKIDYFFDENIKNNRYKELIEGSHLVIQSK